LIWGTGSPLRELLHVDDCSGALVLLLKSCSDMEHINIGSGSENTILELARMVCGLVDFEGRIQHDLS
jgi:GDP-L-fucose synthase